jgi:hypothetical protein
MTVWTKALMAPFQICRVVLLVISSSIPESPHRLLPQVVTRSC